MVDAWNDYSRSHIVSKHALRLIRNFMLTQMPDSVEADEDEEELKAKTKFCEVPTDWATVECIASLLKTDPADDADVGTVNKNTVAKTQIRTQKLWGVDEDEDMIHEVSKKGHVDFYVKKDDMTSNTQTMKATKPQVAHSAKATLQCEGLTKDKADKWFKRLCSHGSDRDTRPRPPKPSDEQQRVIKRIMERCLEEDEDLASEKEIRSEPLRCLLHGVPGAGKSEVIWWLRGFFEDVCGWSHGKQFVYLAFMHSMAALIEGKTFHSFMSVSFNKGDQVANSKRGGEGEHGINKIFLRFESLRWIFIDECSTLGCELLAEGDHTARTYIRRENTWHKRSDGSTRCFGGVNLCFAGDFWQFKPVQQVSILSNPFKRHDSSSVETVLSMFWTHGPDAVQELFELTKEHRCKDEWLSYFLKRARHGNMEHELYCYVHGLPTKHTGSWMPGRNDVICGKASCRALPEKWEREVLAGANRTWSERCSDECDICSEHRQRRCRVLYDDDAEESVINTTKFCDAPLIHPWNSPKYHANQVRAKHFARRTNRILLWAVCEDTPIHGDLRSLPEEDGLVPMEWSHSGLMKDSHSSLPG